jgi:hypothetical protein
MTVILAVLALSNAAFVAFPMLAAIPFVRQTPRLISAARATRRSAPAFTGLTAGLALAFLLWGPFSWTRAALCGVALAGAALSRRNLFEWVFPAASRIETSSASEFREIEEDDMVIGVIVEGAARGYPVRYLAHHHMVNDRLGGAAILPTY